MDYEFSGVQVEQEKAGDSGSRLKAYAERYAETTEKKAAEEKEDGK